LPPPRAGEDEDLRVGIGWVLPADGLDQQRGQRELPDAGVAFGAAFEAAPELAAGLVAHLHDLEDGHRLVEVDPAAAQAGQLPEPQASAQEDEDVIPPGQGHAAQQPAGLFGGVGATPGLPEQLLGIDAPLGWRHLAHRVPRNGALVLGELQDAMEDRSAGQQDSRPTMAASWLASGEYRPGRSARRGGRRTRAGHDAGGGFRWPPAWWGCDRGQPAHTSHQSSIH
jgi:hypothetical protein